ncbi:VWA domain-containing protein [Candidatus Avoscillospira sp. LCP25S3_F1]|uniref:vWA domain-containing protein n=1 Tax=Candidatus Avoscillospira sp. LCP25S3_F1 TaxID=3438825 RepID=UPI003F90C2C7
MKKCPNCSQELEDYAAFCSTCGARQNVEETGSPLSENHTAPLPWEDSTPETDTVHTAGKKTNKKQTIFLVAALMILLIIAGGGWILNSLKEARLQEQLTETLDGADTFERWIQLQQDRMEGYLLTEAEEQQYGFLLEGAEALNATDYAAQITAVNDLSAFEEILVTRLQGEAQVLLEQMESMEPGYASDAQKAKLEEYAAEMKDLIEAGEYKQLDDHVAQWKAFAEEAAQKKTGYVVQIMQHDFTTYPNVRLYLDIEESASGTVPTELSPNMFYVSEKDAKTGNYLPCVVTKAVQINENERLNINILADTSGSMEGRNMDSAKQIMKDFLNTVQFQAGDHVKLTPFNSTIGKLGSFTDDPQSLQREIDSYQPSGQTKLYDSLIYGVQDVSGQEGAKVVLAFTDGMDVGSYNSAQDVVNVVAQYQIPVFIVRIGDAGTAAEDRMLEQIAQASGGRFLHLSQFSTELTEFYNHIYRELKQYYVVEYETQQPDLLTESTDISLYVQNQDIGGEATVQVAPGQELFNSLLGGFLRSYVQDMNAHKYDQLADYVAVPTDPEDRTAIEWQMKTQVLGGFGDIEQETLMDYAITDIQMQEDGSILLSTVENYETQYYETLEDLKNLSPAIASEARNYLDSRYGEGTVDDTQRVRFWVRVNQMPQYILTQSEEGGWKFARYAGNIQFGPAEVFDAEW